MFDNSIIITILISRFEKCRTGHVAMFYMTKKIKKLEENKGIEREGISLKKSIFLLKY